MQTRIKDFFRNEDGAVTVDWVVLTAAVVGLGVAVAVTMTNGTQGLSDDIWAYVDALVLF